MLESGHQQVEVNLNTISFPIHSKQPPENPHKIMFSGNT